MTYIAQGFLDGKLVKQNISMERFRFDGFKLDDLHLQANLNNMEDFDELIDFLKITRECFWEPKKENS